MHVGPKRKKQIDIEADLFKVLPNVNRSSDDL
jgi:hypothetical protein